MPRNHRMSALKRELQLFDYILKKYNLPNDLALAKFLGMGITTLSQVRNDHKRLSARFILRIYDCTDLTIEQIREYAKVIVYDRDE